MNPFSNEPLSKRLRRLRKSKKLTMKEAADRLGVPVTTYREWEYGRSIQGADLYLKLAEVYSVSLGELLGGTKPSGQRVWQEMEAIETHLIQLKKELSSYLEI